VGATAEPAGRLSFRGGARRRAARVHALAWLGLVPFLLYALVFLVLPAAGLLRSAFQDAEGNLTTRYIEDIFQSQYLDAFRTSIELSVVTAVVGGVLGVFICYAAIREGSPRWLSSLVITFSGVASQFGGVPIAFAFISTLGTVGLITTWLNDLGLDLYGQGFSLFSFTGLCIVYVYLQIPLMVLIVAPAIEGLRREWREAATNLGGTNLHYWRFVGVPVLTPAVLSGIIVLFGNAFAAYASAYALTSGKINLVPITIGQVTSGNVIAEPQLGYSLATGMIVVIAVAMCLYVVLERRTSRWLR
jgi:putative spermidine/putrescine transport system permease protein